MVHDSEIIRLNILEEYDVNWSLEFIIRDFLQNYFDSMVDQKEYSFHDSIIIEIDYSKGVGTIRGPIAFDWEDLKYIGGTTKNDKDKYSGGFGEGFLIACLCLKKLKPKININMLIENVELRPFIDSDGVRKEMCFEKIIQNKSSYTTGSSLVFTNCDHQFLNLLSQGKNYFNYPQNPKYTRLIYRDDENGIAIYSYAESNGRIFYRKQDRGPIVAKRSDKYMPFAICYDYHIKDIPDTRDRIDLDKKSINRIFDRTLSEIKDETAIVEILNESKQDWSSGNLILKYLAKSAEGFSGWNWQEKTVKKIIFRNFPKFHVAGASGYLLDWEIKQLFIRLGYIICPEYMKYFGMTSILKQAEKLKEQERLENFRSPNSYEQRKYDLLYDFYDEIKGSKIDRKPLIVFQSKQKKGEYKEANIYLNEMVFNDFSECSATFLHEISHRRGYDDTSGFTDILTLIIQLLINNPQTISKYKKKWDNIDQEHRAALHSDVNEVMLAPIDVKIHKAGCECTFCDRHKNRSFGIGIYDLALIQENDDILKIDPIYTIYAESFHKAMTSARNYCQKNNYEIFEYDLS